LKKVPIPIPGITWSKRPLSAEPRGPGGRVFAGRRENVVKVALLSG
jgi:hypothetical protein